MAYIVPATFAHGDLPTAANLNKFSTSLSYLYASMSSGKKRLRAARVRQWLSMDADSNFTGLTDEANSYCTEVHYQRWLLYGGEGSIANLAGTESTPLADDTPGGTNVFDLDSVDWLNYGSPYYIKGVDWCMEDWIP